MKRTNEGDKGMDRDPKYDPNAERQRTLNTEKEDRSWTEAIKDTAKAAADKVKNMVGGEKYEEHQKSFSEAVADNMSESAKSAANKVKNMASEKYEEHPRSFSEAASEKIRRSSQAAKDKAHEYADKAKDLGSEAAEKAKEVGKEAVDKTKDYAGMAKDKAGAMAGAAMEKGFEYAGKAAEKGKEWASEIADKGKETMESMKEKGKDYAWEKGKEYAKEKGREYAGEKGEYLSEKAKEHLQTAKEKGKEYVDRAKEKGYEYAQSAERGEYLSEKAKEHLQTAKEKGKEYVERAKEKGEEYLGEKGREYAESAKEKGESLTEKAKHMIHDAKEAVTGMFKGDKNVEEEQFTTTKNENAPEYATKSYGLKEKEDYDEIFEKPEVKEGDGYSMFSSSVMVPIGSMKEWEGLKTSDKPVIVDFYHLNCGECKRIYPKLIEKAKKSEGKWVLAGADMGKDNVKPLAKDFKIEAAPTVMLYYKGKVIDHVVGHDEKHLEKLFQKAIDLQ